MSEKGSARVDHTHRGSSSGAGHQTGFVAEAERELERELTQPTADVCPGFFFNETAHPPEGSVAQQLVRLAGLTDHENVCLPRSMKVGKTNVIVVLLQTAQSYPGHIVAICNAKTGNLISTGRLQFASAQRPQSLHFDATPQNPLLGLQESGLFPDVAPRRAVPSTPAADRADLVTRESVETATQFDVMPETTMDQRRCVAAVVVSAAALAGVPQVQHLLGALDPPQLKGRGLYGALLAPVAAEVAMSSGVSANSLQRLQDALFRAVNGEKPSEPGTHEPQFLEMLQLAGLATRPVKTAIDAGAPLDVRRRQLQSLTQELAPGEMVCLFVPPEGGSTGSGNSHVRLLGRDNKGDLFLFDSYANGRDALLFPRANPAEQERFAELLAAATGVYGSVVFHAADSASPTKQSWWR